MRLLDVCAGIGGFSLAATALGWEIAGQVEIDPWCRRVLHKHWPDVPKMADVFDVKGDEFGPVDVITAGIPCQPYSVAGKRRGNADDRALWPEVRRIVATARPAWLCIENVAGFIPLALDGVLADLEADGYAAGAVVVPACAVDAPHRRDRLWLVAHAGSSEGEPRYVAGLFGRRADEAEQTRLGGSGITADVANTNGAGQQERRRSQSVSPEYATAQRGGQDVAHATVRGVRRRSAPGQAGFIAQRDQAGREGDGAHWLPEPAICRVVDGIPGRVDRLKGLGNAVVPQVAYEILRALEVA